MRINDVRTWSDILKPGSWHSVWWRVSLRTYCMNPLWFLLSQHLVDLLLYFIKPAQYNILKFIIVIVNFRNAVFIIFYDDSLFISVISSMRLLNVRNLVWRYKTHKFRYNVDSLLGLLKLRWITETSGLFLVVGKTLVLVLISFSIDFLLNSLVFNWVKILCTLHNVKTSMAWFVYRLCNTVWWYWAPFFRMTFLG